MAVRSDKKLWLTHSDTLSFPPSGVFPKIMSSGDSKNSESSTNQEKCHALYWLLMVRSLIVTTQHDRLISSRSSACTLYNSGIVKCARQRDTTLMGLIHSVLWGPLDFGRILEHTLGQSHRRPWITFFGTDICFWSKVPQLQTKPKWPNPHGLWIIILTGLQPGTNSRVSIWTNPDGIGLNGLSLEWDVPDRLQAFFENVRSCRRSRSKHLK